MVERRIVTVFKGNPISDGDEPLPDMLIEAKVPVGPAGNMYELAARDAAAMVEALYYCLPHATIDSLLIELLEAQAGALRVPFKRAT